MLAAGGPAPPAAGSGLAVPDPGAPGAEPAGSGGVSAAPGRRFYRPQPAEGALVAFDPWDALPTLKWAAQ